MSSTRASPAMSPFVGQLCASAFSASFAEFCTIPSRHGQGADAVAGWGEVSRNAGNDAHGGGGGRRGGAVEGGHAGNTPTGALRGLRIGMYEPVKKFYVGENHVGDVPLHMKIAAGLTTGGLGIMVASPTDLVKVRMQAEGNFRRGRRKSTRAR